jgi:hypothetical protein
MGNQISGGKDAEKLDAKVLCLHRIPFFFEIKVLTLIVQKQKK